MYTPPYSDRDDEELIFLTPTNQKQLALYLEQLERAEWPKRYKLDLRAIDISGHIEQIKQLYWCDVELELLLLMTSDFTDIFANKFSFSTAAGSNKKVSFYKKNDHASCVATVRSNMLYITLDPNFGDYAFLLTAAADKITFTFAPGITPQQVLHFRDGICQQLIDKEKTISFTNPPPFESTSWLREDVKQTKHPVNNVVTSISFAEHTVLTCNADIRSLKFMPRNLSELKELINYIQYFCEYYFKRYPLSYDNFNVQQIISVCIDLTSMESLDRQTMNVLYAQSFPDSCRVKIIIPNSPRHNDVIALTELPEPLELQVENQVTVARQEVSSDARYVKIDLSSPILFNLDIFAQKADNLRVILALSMPDNMSSQQFQTAQTVLGWVRANIRIFKEIEFDTASSGFGRNIHFLGAKAHYDLLKYILSTSFHSRDLNISCDAFSFTTTAGIHNPPTRILSLYDLGLLEDASRNPCFQHCQIDLNLIEVDEVALVKKMRSLTIALSGNASIADREYSLRLSTTYESDDAIASLLDFIPTLNLTKIVVTGDFQFGITRFAAALYEHCPNIVVASCNRDKQIKPVTRDEVSSFALRRQKDERARANREKRDAISNRVLAEKFKRVADLQARKDAADKTAKRRSKRRKTAPGQS